MATGQSALGEPKFGVYNDLDYGYGDSVSSDEYNQDDGSDEEILLWDSFKCTTPQSRSGSMVEKRWYEVMLRVIKAILYVLLFVIILCGSVISKASILFAVSQISGKSVPFCNYYQGRSLREAHIYESTLPLEAQAPWMWCIIFAFSVPEVLDFLRFIWNCFFVDLKLPKFKYIIIITAIEILHTIGMAILFLVALPRLDAIQAAASLTCICIVPVIFGLLSRPLNREKMNESRFYILGDILAFLGQIGGFVSFTQLALKNENSLAPWIFPVALLLSSLRWWANYVSLESRFGFIRYLAECRRNLQVHRSILIGYSSVLRIVTFVIAALIIAYSKDIEPKLFFDGFYMKQYNFTVSMIDNPVQNGSEILVPTEMELSLPVDRWAPLYVLIIQAISCICIYNCGKFACKTLMQGFGFALPLNLAVPVTIIIIWILLVMRDINVCLFHDSYMFDVFDKLFFVADDVKNYPINWYAWVWLIWLLSQLWITIHVWSTRNERLATTDKIFSVLSYDALVIDQSLAMSRWREEPDDDDYTDVHMLPEDIVESATLSKKLSSIKKQDQVTKIYACATMWHETSEEMMDFLSSILRLDRDQCIMRILKKSYQITSPDYYELEVHIFFDDAFKCIHGCTVRCLHDENKTQVNDFVIKFVKAVEKSIRDRRLRSSPPVKFPTPYGGRLLWILPEKTKMYVHLKDKNRIRTRKRWSQVMYMYYLLGYRLMELPIDVERKEVMAENTYILTLDGDIDFRPSAVRTLIDRMRVNKDLGSACGRIHPLGKGPIVWFQKFEYAIGHWLQKSTEHTIGCVLCSPGCFALFRAKALMDFNVMRKYATVPSEAHHFIQYDQGEDRWLCTLILQMGYKIEYSAASDAYTHAPETFNEFFIQRRRWIPSTVANSFDLLETATETKKINRDISWPYICYQYILMGSTILGPGTIFLMLVGAFVAAFRIENWPSFGYNLIPIFIFCLVCYFCKEKTQLLVAGIITAIYGLVMIVVLVGIMIQISDDGWLAPTTLLFFMVAGELVITGILHPLEWSCLVYGVIYYVTVPSMYMLLIIFSLFNMNNVSWGTRDVPKQVVPVEDQQTALKNNQTNKQPVVPAIKKKEEGPIEFSIAGLFKCMLCVREVPPENESQLKEICSGLSQIQNRLDEMERIVDANSRSPREINQNHRTDAVEENVNSNTRGIHFSNYVEEFGDKSESNESSDQDSDIEEDDSIEAESITGSDRFLVSPNWLHSKDLGKGEVEYLKSEEEAFWKDLIGRYLDPIDKDEKREAEIAEQITQLRDQYVFKFFMINALFVLIVFLMQLNKNKLHFQWPLGKKYNVTYDSEANEVKITIEYLRLEPIGFLFIFGFCSVLLLQFLAMLFHRFDTFSHIMAKVTLDWYCCDKATDLSEEAIIERNAEKITKELQREIDCIPKIQAHNSAIPPRKRKTIHQAMAGNDRRQSYASTFSSALQRNLDESGKNGSGLSKRISQTAWQALHRRRTTILQERRQSQLQQQSNSSNSNQSNNIYATANDSTIKERLAQRRPTGPPNARQYAYENPAFVAEADENQRI